jgi:hypothetical protein
MKKSQLYLIAFVLAAIGLGGAFYKWKVLSFPLTPGQEVQVWTVEARVGFEESGQPNTVSLLVPSGQEGSIPGFSISEEKVISRGYSQDYGKALGGRVSEWSIRNPDRRSQALYYSATVVRSTASPMDDAKPRIADPPELSEPGKAAIETLFEQTLEQSADTATFARAFIRKFVGKNLSDEARLLIEGFDSQHERSRFFAQALGIRNIPARIVRGFQLSGDGATRELKSYLQVHNQSNWITIDLDSGDEGFPEDFFLWTRGQGELLSVGSDPNPELTFSVVADLADAMAIAKRSTDVRDTRLLSFSLLSLPASVQANYKLLLMVPVGAFIMLLLRNVVGIKTFGTFMPVLIALAFDKTKLFSGVMLFCIVVGLGLLVRFLLEKIRLLLVPRLTAVLILVVLLMAFVSIMSNRLGFEIGMSVALFPIVIMAMTIERMCVAWDERGPSYALSQGLGSLATACLAYVVMSYEPLKHLFFVFPELLLVLFALTLLIGRYSGYRLTELTRFKSLAK